MFDVDEKISPTIMAHEFYKNYTDEEMIEHFNKCVAPYRGLSNKKFILSTTHAPEGWQECIENIFNQIRRTYG